MARYQLYLVRPARNHKTFGRIRCIKKNMQRQDSRSRPALVFAMLAVLVATIAWFIFKPSPSGSQPPSEPQTAAAEQPAAPMQAAQTAADDTELRAQTPAERSSAPRLPAVIQPVSRPTIPTAAPTTALPAASPATRQMVAGLTNLDFSRGPITKEQAEQWKQGLQGLIAQGNAAVPAIREFLEQNQELNFGAIAGGDQLGQTSLRSALINGLAQIGGPEAQMLMLQTLQSTTLPSEIAQLAQVLEQQAPGQYRQETLNAINEVLAMAGKGQLPANWDVGALFKVLQNYGDPNTASVLEQLQPQWRYYATLTLAGMQDGAGLPALIHEAQDPAAGSGREFAYQMLAQAATQYPDASSALLEAARQGQIPDAAWRKIATGLAGDQYYLGSPPGPPDGSTPTIPGLKTYHIASGNQNFYSLPFGGNGPVSPPAGTGDQLTQRLDLINQLLAATSNPAAQAALQAAKNTLSPGK